MLTLRRSPGTAITDDQPFTVFEPDRLRVFATELLGLVVSVAVGSAIVFFWRGFEPALVLGAIATGLVVVVWVTLARRSRRISIGDTWVSGPTGDSTEPATVLLDTVDWTRSGFRSGRLVLRSSSGHGITVRTGWFASEDVAEIKRLLLERCPAAGLQEFR